MVTKLMHIFKPNKKLLRFVGEYADVDGSAEFLENYCYTAEHSTRLLSKEITERAKNVFLFSMVVNNLKFFKLLGYKNIKASLVVDDLWDYKEYEIDGDLVDLWNVCRNKYKSEIDDLGLFDQTITNYL